MTPHPPPLPNPKRHKLHVTSPSSSSLCAKDRGLETEITIISFFFSFKKKQKQKKSLQRYIQTKHCVLEPIKNRSISHYAFHADELYSFSTLTPFNIFLTNFQTHFELKNQLYIFETRRVFGGALHIYIEKFSTVGGKSSARVATRLLDNGPLFGLITYLSVSLSPLIILSFAYTHTRENSNQNAQSHILHVCAHNHKKKVLIKKTFFYKIKEKISF